MLVAPNTETNILVHGMHGYALYIIYIYIYIYTYIYIYIHPPLSFELLMKTKALFLQFRVLFPDICKGLAFWVVVCLPR